MSKHPSDSFLPSGAVDPPSRKIESRSNSMASSMAHVPRSVPSVPDYVASQSSRNSPRANLRSPSPSPSPSQHPNGRPISPPKTRSASADYNSAALVEDWRLYTQKLRTQSDGEKAHMAADRARMEEVMAEERALWETERDTLKARIEELEVQLERRASHSSALNVNHKKLGTYPNLNPIGFTSPGSNTGSMTGSIDSAKHVPQESGRNADGSPFYAPASRNPSRTFEQSETSGLRVDSITAPRETALRVTSKELTLSDFGLQSPPDDLASIPEGPVESIDISHIQPELDGVPIKASAVSPTFVAKVLSPEYSPAKTSPRVKSPVRDATNQPLSRSPSGKEKKPTVDGVMLEPENKRLTMHAGHTPNHSISKFDFMAESENATPRQNPAVLHRLSLADTNHGNEGRASEEGHVEEEEEDGDKELTGPLGFTNQTADDDLFLAQLVEKLREAKKTEGVSPSTESSSSLEGRRERAAIPGPKNNGAGQGKKGEGNGEGEDVPPLRLKSSSNFGRPMGSM